MKKLYRLTERGEYGSYSTFYSNSRNIMLKFKKAVSNPRSFTTGTISLLNPKTGNYRIIHRIGWKRGLNDKQY